MLIVEGLPIHLVLLVTATCLEFLEQLESVGEVAELHIDGHYVPNAHAQLMRQQLFECHLLAFQGGHGPLGDGAYFVLPVHIDHE